MPAAGLEYPPISDYGLIGDSRACALVSGDGSIDWLCLPRPDSPSIFGRILDWQGGGHFQIAPSLPYSATRRYLPGTNVLETSFVTADGAVTLTDFMPAQTEESKSTALNPLRAVIRIVEGKSGRVPMTLAFQPRPDYGKTRPVLKARGPNRVVVSGRGQVLMLHSQHQLQIADHAATSSFAIAAGEVCQVCLSYSEGEPAVILEDDYALKVREETIRFWQDWSSHLNYQGPRREEVLRSALALKLLSYAPSGAMLAAPTTSLPEDVGGERNWDYRYCWPRDAALSVKALVSIGLAEEAEAFFAWLLHATRLTLPRLQPIYSILGESHLKERSLDHLSGYRGSRPVRLGNAAFAQSQLDVYGELMDAAHAFLLSDGRKGRIDGDEAGFIRTIANFVADNWRQPDSGIWEARVPPMHYTHSKVMAWLCLVRAADLQAEGLISGPAERWLDEARQIRELVLMHGYNAKLQAFTQTLDGDTLDASVLHVSLCGFLPANDPRYLSTLRAIRSGLEVNGFLKRYTNFEDGLAGVEGAFLICNFWLAAALARSGDARSALEVFERTLESTNDLLLLPEEFDPVSHEALGNFPQAFSHLGLILAALEIEANSRSD